MDDVRNERPTYIGIESPFFFSCLLRATKGTGHCGSDVQFYAKYPAELFDELVHALVQLYEPGVAPRGDAKFLPFDSVLICSRSWWRVFKSLQPSCPLNIDVFVRFSDAWWGVLWPGGGVQPNAEHRAVRRELAGEVKLLEQWLTTTGMHEERPSRKGPAERKLAQEKTATHSEHFDSVNWYGTPYTFTAKQAAVVKVLWEAWHAGKPSVLGVVLIDKAGSDGRRVRDIFKSGKNLNPAWGEMIVKDGRSHFKLSDPKIPEPQQRPT